MTGADQAARTSRGHQALHLAAENGHADTVRMLLDNGADPEAKDEVRLSLSLLHPPSPPPGTYDKCPRLVFLAMANTGDGKGTNAPRLSYCTSFRT